MANQLKVAKVLSIHALHAQGWSQRRIARELGISRDAVARRLKEGSNQAKAPTGSGDSKPANSAHRVRGGCRGFKPGQSAHRVSQSVRTLP